MGGGGGGKKPSSPPPPQAQPLDMGQITQSATASAKAQLKSQYEELIKNYPKIEELNLGTVRKISDNLDNQSTKDAQHYIRQALALGEMDPDVSQPTSIEQRLYQDAERDLTMGRALSPEQLREAQQAARSAYEARGMALSPGAIGTEILSRDAMATARERERQGFAAQVNAQNMSNIMARRGALADLYYAGSGNLINADPYQRALGPGLGWSGSSTGAQMNMGSNTFASMNELAGQTAMANAQMQEGRYNSYQNRQAALQAARMQAGATNNAATMGLVGAGVGAAATIGVAAIAI